MMEPYVNLILQGFVMLLKKVRWKLHYSEVKWKCKMTSHCSMAQKDNVVKHITVGSERYYCW